MSHGRRSDLVAEIDAELVAARRRAAWDDALVRGLERLLEETRALARELGRPATPADLLAGASTAADRLRRRQLLQALRRRS